MPNKEVVKMIQKVRFKAYEKLYGKLETKNGEKDIFKITRLREKKN